MTSDFVSVYTIPGSINGVPVTQIVYVMEGDPQSECNKIYVYSDGSSGQGWQPIAALCSGTSINMLTYSLLNGLITGVVNGVNTVFTMATPFTFYALYVNGVLQTPGLHYTITGNIINLVSPLQPGNTLLVNGHL